MTDYTDMKALLNDALIEAQDIASAPPPITMPTQAVAARVGSPLAPLVDVTSWAVYGKSGATMIKNITAAWNGAAFDRATKTLHLVACGGHGDSWINQCFECDVTTGAWRVTATQTPFPPDQHVSGYAPTLTDGVTPTAGTGWEPDGKGGQRAVTPYVGGAPSNGGVAVYWDGKPASRHTYGGQVWLPNEKRVLLLSGSQWSLGGSDDYAGRFDPVSGTWERKSNVNGFTALLTSEVGGIVYWARKTTASVWMHDPAADTHVKIGPPSSDPLGGGAGQNGQIATDGKYVYAVYHGGWGAVLPTRPEYANSIVRMQLGQSQLAPWVPVQVTGDMTDMNGYAPGMEYDPDLNALVFWSAQSPQSISVLTLDDMKVVRLPLSGVTFSAAELTDSKVGVWGRFRRYDTLRYCLMTSANSPLYQIALQ